MSKRSTNTPNVTRSIVITNSSSKYCAHDMLAPAALRCLAPPCLKTYSVHQTARSSGVCGASLFMDLSLFIFSR